MYNEIYKLFIFIVIILIVYLLIDYKNYSNTNEIKKDYLYTKIEKPLTPVFKKLNIIKQAKGREYKINSFDIIPKQFDIYLLDSGYNCKEDLNIINFANSSRDDINNDNTNLICNLIKSLNPNIRIKSYKICSYDKKVYYDDYEKTINSIKKINPRAIIISNIVPFNNINLGKLIVFCPSSNKNNNYISIGSYDSRKKIVNKGLINAPYENIKINNNIYTSKIFSPIIACVYLCSNYNFYSINDVFNIINNYKYHKSINNLGNILLQ